MISKKYKFGEIKLEILTPVDFKDTEPFKTFIKPFENPNYKITIELVDELSKTILNYCYKADDSTCVRGNDKIYIYYKDRDNLDGFYALRIIEEDKNECVIRFRKSFTDNISSRTVFAVIGIEEIAAVNNAAILHSSFVNLNGESLIFTGPSGIGKSTQADLWANYRNAEIINGDKTLLYIKDNKAYASGLPFSGTSKFCKNKSIPVKNIISLSQAEKNKAQRLNGFKSFIEIYRGCYPIPYSKLLTNRQTDLIEQFSKKVNVYEYACLPDETSVSYLEEKICQNM